MASGTGGEDPAIAGVDGAAGTFWEEMAQTRWGAYLRSVEESVLRYALTGARPGTALEVGCDGGAWSVPLAAAGWSNVCLDVRPEALELCARRLPNARCVLVDPDDTAFPVGERSVDLVLVYEVSPVTNSSWFLREAMRVLRPGGRLVFVVNNPSSLRGALYRARMPLSEERQQGRAYDGPPFRQIARGLEEHGFELLRAEGFAWAPFSRTSNSRLVPVLIRVERALGLRRLVRYSPWVAVAARRRGAVPIPALNGAAAEENPPRPGHQRGHDV